MKLFTGWVMSAGLVLAAAGANAQGVAPGEAGRLPTTAVSDFGGPYAAMPPGAPVPGSGPTLLPPLEVYTVVRESGFSPLGIPRQRGMFYVIAVIDRNGDDGRLVIDARNGLVVRFLPAYRMGDNRYDAAPPTYAPGAPPPTVGNLSGPPRPPASVPKLASRTPPTVPMPKASPLRPADAGPLAGKPASEPAQQSAAVQTKSADTPATPQAASAVKATPAALSIQPTQPKPMQQSAAVQAKPGAAPAVSQVAPPVVEARPAAPQIQPTQPMPGVQGLE